MKTRSRATRCSTPTASYDSDSNTSNGTSASIGTVTMRTTRSKKVQSKHVRSGGGDDLHECKVCGSNLTVRPGSNAHYYLSRCPNCYDMYHSQCIQRYVRKTMYAPACPNCRFPIESIDVWAVPEDWTEDTLFESEDDEYQPSRRSRVTHDIALRSRSRVHATRGNTRSSRSSLLAT